MKIHSRYLMSGAAMLTFVICCLQSNSHFASSAPAPPTSSVSPEVSVRGYRRWVKVNSKPHIVLSSLDHLCRNMTLFEQAQHDADPHNHKLVMVYVNQVAENAMMQEKSPKFPQGSLIVKEKLTYAKNSPAELLTIMLKREKGYDTDGGDWEYLVFDGTASKVQARGQLKNCQSCHAEWKKTDYVSRKYLSNDVMRKLR